jgi:ABC-type bacteriocin/lantibiotic exporter with double-glycine peptidase domain
VLCSGGYLVIRGLLSIGAFVAFQSIAAGFSAPIAQFVTFTSSIQEVRTLSERLDDALLEQVDSTTQGDLYPRGITEENLRLDGRIDLRDVSFGFKSTRPPLISDLTLSVPAGQRVAIVGGSGSGKSTVVRLIAGLHTPWSGEVLLDGLEHEDVPRPVFRASVAMVDQTIALFHGTVRDNLTLWDPTVSEEDIVRACQDAQIHDLIVSRPGGYDSMVEEGGRNFSGGQRQRLEIARSLVRNPTILLLDEATSALDAETEALIDWALRRRGCTCIIVAHRLSTVRDADLIVLLEKGRDIERGTHDELIALNGHYAELVAQ